MSARSDKRDEALDALREIVDKSFEVTDATVEEVRVERDAVQAVVATLTEAMELEDEP